MPLNPPSYHGQDVWYSPNVFINKVEAALWQPAQPMISAVVNTTVPPLPKLEFSQSQLSMIQQSVSDYSYTNPDTGEKVTMNLGEFPNADAEPGQWDGPEASVTAPQNQAPLDGNVYNNLIANLSTVIREAKSKAWVATTTNPNLIAMCKDLGATWGQPYGPRQAGGWCAMFVSWILYKSGIPILVSGKTQRAMPRAASWATYGTRISPQDPKAWRKGDIIVCATTGATTRSGNHVGFLWGINSAANTIYLAGGNQGSGSGDVNADSWERNFLTNSRSGASGPRAVAVVRGWTLPPGLDVPLPGA